MDVISPLIVSIFFAIAAALKMYHKQGEHAFTRAVIAVWYFWLWQHPDTMIETQRLMGRWAILFLAAVEVLSVTLRAWQNKKYNDAMRRRK